MHGRLLSYAILLDTFDYVIHHAMSKSHMLPDSFSRRPFTPKESEASENSTEELDSLFLNSITEKYFQKTEPAFDQLMKSLSRPYRRHAIL